MTPLSGLRVLDLSNMLAGPFCGHQLAALGADVVKIEPPGGDSSRPLGQAPALNAARMGVNFLAQNAGKRSLVLDLKTEGGRGVAERLAAGADVVLENFRPGVLERLGLGPDRLHALNPRLVICRISGYGQATPWAKRPAYDQIVQAVTGVMATAGHPGEPMRAGWPVCDMIAGMTAALAITAALRAGRGTVIDLSMVEATLATMGWPVSNWLIGGVAAQGHGNENPTAAPSGAFQCADRQLVMAANQDKQWVAIAGVLGREDLLDQPDYATNEDRKANRHRLRAELETVLTTRPAAEWVAALVAAGVPAGEVLPLAEALEAPPVASGDLVTPQPVPGQGELPLLNTAIRYDGARPVAALPPPPLGAHAEEVLAAAGYSAAEIAALRAEGALG